MSTPTRGVPITLGGIERSLRFTNKSLVMLEDQADLTVMQLGERLRVGSLKAIGLAVWAGLQHEDKPPTKEEAVDLVELSRLGEISAALAGAISAAFGDMGKGEEGEEKKKEAPEGDQGKA